MNGNFNRKPSPNYRFFMFDPEGDGLLFFRTEEERDAVADVRIQQYLADDGWLESVEDVFTGYVTGHAVPADVEFLPLRWEFEADEAYQAAQDELGFYEVDDHDHRCNYRLADINDPGESTER